MSRPITKDNLTDMLDRSAGLQVPGLQYIVANDKETLFEYAGGWADIRHHRAMTLDATMMAYSMTKTFTAVAIIFDTKCCTIGASARFPPFGFA